MLLNVTLKEAMDYINVPSAAIVIQNDTIVFEHYSGGWDRNSQSCVFSVTKTVTSLLCGIALKEGCIKSVNDPVTDYIPEMKKADPMFSHTPGESFSYDSATTAILGLVIERATGQSYSQYLSEKVWQPLGMERDALIGLDSKKHHTAKSFAGLTTNVCDLAKIGRLFLNHGNMEGNQILDSKIVSRCLTTHDPGIVGKRKGRYSYSWYWGFNDSYYDGNKYHERRYFQTEEDMREYYKAHQEKSPYMVWRTSAGYFGVFHNGGHWAFGLYGQVLYVNPSKNIVAVFLGADRVKDFNILFDQLSVSL